MATLVVNVAALRRFMEQRGWSERDLAEHMDLAYSYVNRVLGGKRRPGAKFIAGTLLLGLSMEEVFTIEK
ncbi:helix-turn-helix domain-containing protein [Sulfobacillus thermosulfidooxidans]|uniref:Helix-turn-helix n=2 Tax=Sulfobacillus thermosulfidooxidans TaxID=28034 RepID=A0A1W1W5W3_SULTA|nr:helix-turn-helix transcriptional regulator [Sulfobacillus thermosulfidooxidans]OLZ09845.1 hypothetical protein BFX05_13000 [Sulfobacillus thermosulfidooxidans]OLZ15849.1 hypothetical protein BFX06_02040 [Sulfobacillus thermosulfidooxidans]OLZ18304.1 hypothetical protein BFX07_08085 [Sulfobacillus thermosulfidooxidans]PSR24272.1 MAG: XRE family transcriptional regulator [Sulfobacillus thermosulfidooxidans]SMC01687.1 Helix-turn-helix [Sulfobacillus thermosulfidooxidans DSM 9293]